MFPSDASYLVAYVMTHNRMTQPQAMEWLDKWTPHWRTEEPNQPVAFTECNGDDND